MAGILAGLEHPPVLRLYVDQLCADLELLESMCEDRGVERDRGNARQECILACLVVLEVAANPKDLAGVFFG